MLLCRLGILASARNVVRALGVVEVVRMRVQSIRSMRVMNPKGLRAHKVVRRLHGHLLFGSVVELVMGRVVLLSVMLILLGMRRLVLLVLMLISLR